MTDYTWIGGSGDFGDSNNWENDSTGMVGDGTPGASDYAHIVNAGTITGSGTVSDMDIIGGVTFESGTIAITSYDLYISDTGMTVGKGATIDAERGITALPFSGGTIDVNGGVVETGYSAQIGTESGNGGTVELDIQNGGRWTGGVVMGPTEPTALDLTSGGTLDGDVSLDNCTATVSNASLTGDVFLGSTAASTFTARGATINAGALFTVGTTSTATIHGGTLQGAELEIGGSGTLELENGVSVTLAPAGGGDQLVLSGTLFAVVGAGTQLTGSGISSLQSGLALIVGGAQYTDAELEMSGTATMTVSGSGSKLTDSGLSGTAVSIGSYGTASLSIKDGAIADATGTVLLGLGGSTTDPGKGKVVVTGTGSAWTVDGNLGIGDGGDGPGNGTVTVEDNASLSVTGTSHILGLGLEADGKGTLDINDGTVTAAGLIESGGTGSGDIDVEHGGSLASQSTIKLGVGKNTTTIAVIEDTGSQITAAANLVVGDHGKATLTMTSGATADAGKWLVLGVKAGSDGTFDIEDSNTTVTATTGTAVGGSETAVGGSETAAGGSALLRLTDGGTLDAGHKLMVWGNGTLSLDSDSIVNVGDASATAGNLGVGQGGTVENDGKIAADYFLLSGNGSYQADNSAGVAKGALTLADGIGTSGHSTLDLAGGGSITVGTSAKAHDGALSIGENGTAVLHGESFSGAIWLEGGLLQIGASGASGDGTIHFQGSGNVMVVQADVTVDNAIAGFAGGDTIELRGVTDGKDTKIHYADHMLTISDGTDSETLLLNGSYTRSDFHLSVDASGGTDVTYGTTAVPSVDAHYIPEIHFFS